jgi:ribose 1,5-bisphosphate isomerase
MDTFEKILRAIKAVKIQGAENIAINAVKAFEHRGLKIKTHSAAKFFFEIEATKRLLFASRPTEPLMRNSLLYVIDSLKTDSRSVLDLKKALRNFCSETLDHFESAQQKIAEIGAKKIDKGMIVFTHCHSSTVMRILKEAKRQGKRFEVYNTEARPLFQGRVTAKELAKMRIPVTHFVDSAARIALKKADVFLMGFDAVTTTKVYNKIGSEMFALIADKYDVPIYACGDAWKFDPAGIAGCEEKIELRPSKEIWPSAPRGVKIENPCFEKINPELLTAIISELGVYAHENFVEEVKKTYPWLSE